MTWLIASLLIVPVVLLGSPIILFYFKGRSDLAHSYIGSMILMQWLVAGLHWEQLNGAALAVVYLLGIALLLGSLYTLFVAQKHEDWKEVNMRPLKNMALMVTVSTVCIVFLTQG